MDTKLQILPFWEVRKIGAEYVVMGYEKNFGWMQKVVSSIACPEVEGSFLITEEKNLQKQIFFIDEGSGCLKSICATDRYEIIGRCELLFNYSEKMYYWRPGLAPRYHEGEPSYEICKCGKYFKVRRYLRKEQRWESLAASLDAPKILGNSLVIQGNPPRYIYIDNEKHTLCPITMGALPKVKNNGKG